LVTPIRRSEFILGKSVPFVLVGAADAILISLIGIFWFGVPFRGSVAVFAIGTLGFLLCALAIGLLISTISATQQQAMVSAFFIIMPAVIFSGFATPIASIPTWLSWVSYVNPLRYYLVIIRGVFLKGLSLGVLMGNIGILALMALALLALSIARFQKSLD
jgi:ABC-2 type transport system permease protein